MLLAAIQQLLNHYRQIGEVASAKVVATYYTNYLTDQRRTDAELDKPRTLKRLSGLHEYLDSPEEAIRLTQAASGLAPSDFDLGLRLGRLLVDAGRFEEAQVELQWCLRRQPDHAELLTLLATANRNSLLRQADAATTPSSRGSDCR